MHESLNKPTQNPSRPTSRDRLAIGKVDDPMEQEADAMADKIMRMPDAVFVQRKCAQCEGEEEKIQRKPSQGFFQRKKSQSTQTGTSLSQSITTTRGNGLPVPEPTRSFMESRFAADFSKVRLHTGDDATQLSRRLDAQAFTTGSDIYFNEGKFAPDQAEGRHLLAHELTHTIQQQGATGAPVQRVMAAVDIAAISQEIREATEGWGTDEERIFVNLQRLGKDPANISALIADYKKQFNESLEGVLRDELSGSELQLALEEIGIATPGSASMMATGAPSTDAEFNLAAQRLDNAMRGLGTDEEAIYSVLLPFNRDATGLTKLKSVYKTLTGRELQADIEDEMSSDELAYALYLLNAPPDAGLHSRSLTGAGKDLGSGTVPGGTVTVRTGDQRPGQSGDDLFTIGYIGGSSQDSRWLQFIWREMIVTEADGSVKALNENYSNGKVTYNLTTDPDNPIYNTDTNSSTSPFYQDGFLNNRTADSTTLIDEPGPIDTKVQRHINAGATKVISRSHFNTFLIRDYRPLFQVSLTVEWTYTNSTIPPRMQKLESAKSVDHLPSDMRATLLKQFPSYNYIL
ncbi:MAG: DUF4157 domain-containing protein [Flavisolibacter sp.]